MDSVVCADPVTDGCPDRDSHGCAVVCADPVTNGSPDRDPHGCADPVADRNPDHAATDHRPADYPPVSYADGGPDSLAFIHAVRVPDSLANTSANPRPDTVPAHFYGHRRCRLR